MTLAHASSWYGIASRVPSRDSHSLPELGTVPEVCIRQARHGLSKKDAGLIWLRLDFPRAVFVGIASIASAVSMTDGL